MPQIQITVILFRMGGWFYSSMMGELVVKFIKTALTLIELNVSDIY